MEIIEKQVEKVKEVPADGYYGYGYGRRDIKRAITKAIEDSQEVKRKDYSRD